MKEKNSIACRLIIDVILEFAPRFPFLRNIRLYLMLRIFLTGLPSRYGFCHASSFERRRTNLAMHALCFASSLLLSFPFSELSMSFLLSYLLGGTLKWCRFNNLLLRIVTCTHIQMHIPTHHILLPWPILMPLVSTTQCLSVVAGYHGHVIGTSLRKWKLGITSVSYAIWCNSSRRNLLRVRQICLLGNRQHLPAVPP